MPAFALVGGENNGWKVGEHPPGARARRRRPHRAQPRVGPAAALLPGDQARRRAAHASTQDVRDVLADIYIKAEVTRLFGLRNFWLTYARRPRSYEGPQLSYYRKMAGLWMTGAILEAVGPAALTSDPAWGSPDGLPRAAAAQRHRGRAPGRHRRHPAREHGAAHRHRPGRAREGRHRAQVGVSMDLALTESQEMLRATARSFMEREAPKDVIVGCRTSRSGLDPRALAEGVRGWAGSAC